MIIDYGYDPNILQQLKLEKDNNIKNGFYHYIQIQFAYASNHLEGSTLTPEQTRLIFDKGRIDGQAKVNEVFETSNHFKMFDRLLDTISMPLTVDLIKELHQVLRNGIDSDAGQFKRYQNQIGDIDPISTTKVKAVPQEIDTLLAGYNNISGISLEDIASFHCRFEKIHPFQDGNGRTGRAIMFRECIRNNIMPFVIYENFRGPYISGINQWRNGNKQQLLETINACQEIFRQNYLYFMGKEEVLVTPTYNSKQFNEDTAFFKREESDEEPSDSPDPTDNTDNYDI